MIPKLEFEEIATVLIANNHNLTIPSLDFLQSSGVIPSDWKLVKTPVINSQMTEVEFTNDIIISVNLNKVIFSQTIEPKAPNNLQILTLVHKYIAALPNINYQSIEINPSCFFTFDNDGETEINHYIVTKLLSPRNWHELSNKPVKATLNLAYTLERGEFNLKIDDVQLRQPNNTPQSGVLFSGNFPYEINEDTSLEQQQHLYQLLDNWQHDLNTFREIVNQRFLNRDEHSSVL
ncbi:hypothetical protein OGM63_27080 [Plectonema radiosum NIES-515]|uniref:Uncharacterized protein n=1 Tax=Plectonema radiosum NIES-515 TaxID=2986073 RepID=A0ABT3B715_9CYAN|nr:hypothetical protein [Plectonema radiosum]MCV3217129.1 hypothetical protein [Plectonema radiosum NIES-515]